MGQWYEAICVSIANSDATPQGGRCLKSTFELNLSWNRADLAEWRNGPNNTLSKLEKWVQKYIAHK